MLIHILADGARRTPCTRYVLKRKLLSIAGPPIPHSLCLRPRRDQRKNFRAYIDRNKPRIFQRLYRRRGTRRFKAWAALAPCLAGSCLNSSCDSPLQPQPYQPLVPRYASSSIQRPLSVLALDLMTLPPWLEWSSLEIIQWLNKQYHCQCWPDLQGFRHYTPSIYGFEQHVIAIGIFQKSAANT